MTKTDTPDPITPVLTRRWLSPRAWDIDVYEQLEGYTALRYALTGHPDQLIELVKAHPVTFRWVKGHSGDAMNDLVDAMAVAAIPR